MRRDELQGRTLTWGALTLTRAHRRGKVLRRGWRGLTGNWERVGYERILKREVEEANRNGEEGRRIVEGGMAEMR